MKEESSLYPKPGSDGWKYMVECLGVGDAFMYGIKRTHKQRVRWLRMHIDSIREEHEIHELIYQHSKK